MPGNSSARSFVMNMEQAFVYGVVAVMITFVIVLGGAAYLSRDRK
jgi:hypothetical protein